MESCHEEKTKFNDKTNFSLKYFVAWLTTLVGILILMTLHFGWQIPLSSTFNETISMEVDIGSSTAINQFTQSESENPSAIESEIDVMSHVDDGVQNETENFKVISATYSQLQTSLNSESQNLNHIIFWAASRKHRSTGVE